jgi:hypothetical protein
LKNLVSIHARKYTAEQQEHSALEQSYRRPRFDFKASFRRSTSGCVLSALLGLPGIVTYWSQFGFGGVW